MLLDQIKSTELKVQPYPSLIKYMGSKSKIMDFVFEGINEVYRGGGICDLFAGSASLAGAIGQQCEVHSNDIQSYSSILADTYNKAFLEKSSPAAEEIIAAAEKIFKINKKDLNLDISLSHDLTMKKFNELESLQQSLIDRQFSHEWHLFVKNYSGTWWSAEQCLWIDAIRETADNYKEHSIYPVILSSLMFAMAYTSQGTGHYAQYRDAKTKTSFSDILIYRKRSIPNYFQRKYKEITSGLTNKPPVLNHKSTSIDFKDCLKSFSGGVVYADPPYCFVHYSRFYHALETLVLYDYPELQLKNGSLVKGRYREGRHQSPFCIKSKVIEAFEELFNGVNASGSNLVLSYSNTGMIEMGEIEAIALDTFKNKKIEILTKDHKHMTLGRRNDRQRNVKECLFLIA